MERLTAQDEELIQEFRGILNEVNTVEDMFPPDIGVRLRPDNPLPLLPPLAVALALEAEVVSV